jgi:hypothetical protein
VFPRLLLAGFLLAHAAIHVGFISPRPPSTAGGPQWPFELSRSWALTPLGVDADLGRILGMALVAATLGGFAIAAIAALGFVPAAIWPAASAIGAIASIALLLLFFHPWLVLGVGIDLVLLWAVLVVRWGPGWLAE